MFNDLLEFYLFAVASFILTFAATGLRLDSTFAPGSAVALVIALECPVNDHVVSLISYNALMPDAHLQVIYICKVFWMATYTK